MIIQVGWKIHAAINVIEIVFELCMLALIPAEHVVDAQRAPESVCCVIEIKSATNEND